MERKNRVWSALAGGAAGVVNGLFGGGGGMILVPLLTGRVKLDQRRAFATSLLIILPITGLSLLVYSLKGAADLPAALPYLLGGLAGGAVGGKVFKALNMNGLRRVFALVILYGGVRALL